MSWVKIRCQQQNATTTTTENNIPKFHLENETSPFLCVSSSVLVCLANRYIVKRYFHQFKLFSSMCSRSFSLFISLPLQRTAHNLRNWSFFFIMGLMIWSLSQWYLYNDLTKMIPWNFIISDSFSFATSPINWQTTLCRKIWTVLLSFVVFVVFFVFFFDIDLVTFTCDFFSFSSHLFNMLGWNDKMKWKQSTRVRKRRKENEEKKNTYFIP